MNSLAVFEVAARHLSFTRAAEDLTISREAVSRHIRGLEEHLGVPLFNRLHRALELTDAGHRFRASVEDSLDAIRLAARSLRSEREPATVTVIATIAVSSFWLTPRLARFRMRAPNVRIRVLASDTVPDFHRERIDAGVLYGDGDWRGLQATRLFPLHSFPVCAPDYLERHGPIESPRDLHRHTLLNLAGGRHSSEDWLWWLGEFGSVDATSLQTVDFDSYANVIQAALEGHGVALGFGGLIDDVVDRGSLVRPLGAVLNPGHAAYLVVPEKGERTRSAVAFAEWITEEGERTRQATEAYGV